MRSILGCVLLAMSIWPGVARADWFEASSDHFVIYADDNERDLRTFSEQLERYHAGMALLTSSQQPVPSPSNRVTVYVVRSEQAVRSLYGKGGRYVAGFYIPRAGGSVAIVPRVDAAKGKSNFAMVTLLHEYAHHFLISAATMAGPRWFGEGAAEFFASSSFEPDGSVMLGRPAEHRAGELFLAPDVKVSQLLDPAIYEKRANWDYDAFYGKSWLLYHYLTFDKDRAGQLQNYLTLLGQGKGQREAALQALGDFDKLEDDLDRYLQRRRVMSFKIPPDKLRIGAITLRKLGAGETAIMPVRIRARVGVDASEAAALLVEARAVAARFPQDPAVLAQLAEAEFDAGNDTAAVEAADAALSRDRSQVNAYLQKGYALFRMAAAAEDKAAAFKRARAPFVALNRLENDHPQPLVFFYRSYAEQGLQPPALAVTGLVRAVQLAPFDLGLRFNLATALISEGRGDEARVALQPIANSPHEGSLVEAARAVLARLDKEPTWKGEGLQAMVSKGAGGESGGTGSPP